MTDALSEVVARFPKLTPETASITSTRTDAYNCVAWIARRVDQWWSPEPVDGYWWPLAPQDDSIEEYVRLFDHMGFSPCTDASLEEGIEKIAIYGDSEDFDHVAFQRSDGRWSSKLGELNDISHTETSLLAGPGLFEYEPVVILMKRTRQPHDLAETGLILPGR